MRGTARTTVLSRYGFTPDFRYYDDHDLWARMAMGGERLTSQPQVLGTYRRHPGHTTAQRQAVALQEKKRIAAPQLARLGLLPDDQDLARHVWLKTHHLAPPEALADPQYLRWAGDWLEALLAANARMRVYDRAAFESVTAQVWCRLLRQARKSGTSLPTPHGRPRPMRGLSLRRAAAARWWERAVRAALLRVPAAP